MDVLTLVRAKELTAQILAEFGEDYVYPEEHKVQFPGNEEPSCMYVHEEKPSCLVGQVLHRHGVSLEAMSKYENIGAYRVLGEVTPDAIPEVMGYLSHMQWRQDEGASWGKAVESANHNYR